MEDKKEKLWTTSFLLLWQGQLVSILGDVVYAVALGFWILEATGSTALMGALLAVSTLPRIVVSPIAGVIVDRSDRRKLMIWMDVIRGISSMLLLAAFPFVRVFSPVLAMLAVAGFGNAILDVFIMATVQLTVP
jgi:DHA3 family macrolide efflux protein-like MFS transporter